MVQFCAIVVSATILNPFLLPWRMELCPDQYLVHLNVHRLLAIQKPIASSDDAVNLLDCCASHRYQCSFNVKFKKYVKLNAFSFKVIDLFMYL